MRVAAADLLFYCLSSCVKADARNHAESPEDSHPLNQLPISRETGQVRTSTHMAGLRVNQAPDSIPGRALGVVIPSAQRANLPNCGSATLMQIPLRNASGARP